MSLMTSVSLSIPRIESSELESRSSLCTVTTFGVSRLGLGGLGFEELDLGFPVSLPLVRVVTFRLMPSPSYRGFDASKESSCKVLREESARRAPGV